MIKACKIIVIHIHSGVLYLTTSFVLYLSLYFVLYIVSVLTLLNPVNNLKSNWLFWRLTLVEFEPEDSKVLISFTFPKLSHSIEKVYFVSMGLLTYSNDLLIIVSLVCVRSTVVYFSCLQ